MSPRSLAATLPKITKATLAKHGRAYAAIVGEWPMIVGKATAEGSVPEKLVAGVLTIRASGGSAMEIQHSEPQILERINAYIGSRAVDRLRLIQAPVTRARRRAPPPPPPAPNPRLETELSGVADPDLKAALHRFGRHLGPRQKSEK